MTSYKDINVTLGFNVPPGDSEGTFTEALFDAALEHAPVDSSGFVARADTDEGKVWITFTLSEVPSREYANDIGMQMRERVKDAVLSNDDACVLAD